jgi:hypothetical protein
MKKNRKSKKKTKRRNRNAKILVRQRGVRQLTAPVTIGGSIHNVTPMRQHRVSHREFFQNVTADGTTGQVHQYQCNPAQEHHFPLLSRIASAFESYIFTKLEFYYQPAVSTSTAGRIALCPDYDPADDNSTLDKTSLLSFEDAGSFPLWQPGIIRCSPRNLRKRKEYYTRRNTSTTTTEIRQTDALRLWVVIDSAASAHIGELWVNYDITFFTPQIQSEEADTFATKDGTPTAANEPFSEATTTLLETVSNSPFCHIADGHTLHFHRPGRFQVEGVAVASGGTVNGVQPWVAGANVTLASGAWLYDIYQWYLGARGLASAVFDVGPNASADNPGIITWAGVSLSAGNVIRFFTNASEVAKLIVS